MRLRRTNLAGLVVFLGGLGALSRAALAQQTYEELTYDSQGSLIVYKGPVYGPNYDQNELDALTSTWSYTYPSGYVICTSATRPLGHAVSYSFDSAYRLTQASYQNGARVEAYSYDSQDRVTQVTTTCGTETSTIHYTYISPTRARDTDIRGKIRETQTNSFGRVTLTAGPADDGAALDALIARGAVRTYAYDSAGRLASETDEVGAVTSYAYDSTGNLTSITDPTGRSTVYTYDPLGRVTSVAYPGVPQGMAHRYFYYNGAGQTWAQAKRHDAQTLVFEGYVYDGAGRMTQVVGPASNLSQLSLMIASGTNVVHSCSYDALGRMVGETWLDGAAVARTYDARGNLLSEVNSAGPSRAQRWDYADRIISVRDGGGEATAYMYDVLDRPGTMLGPWHDMNGDHVPNDGVAAPVTAATYNIHDLQTFLQTDSLTPTTISYEGALPTVVQTGAVSLIRTYDACGALVYVSSTTGVAASYVRDDVGRVITSRTGPGTSGEIREDRSYDAAGRCTSVTAYPTPLSTAGAVTATYSYDAAGNKSSGVEFGGAQWSATFDLDGRQLSFSRNGGLVTTRSYTSLGLLASVTACGGPTIAYSYDSGLRLASVTEGGTRTWTYGYDPVGREVLVTYPGGKTLTIGYDSVGRISTETFGPSGYARTRQYDGHSRVVSLSDGTSSMAYQYDAYGRLSATTDQAARTTSFTRDADGDLVSCTYPAGDVFTYACDSLKRPISISRTAGGLTSVVAGMAYDAMGRLTSWTHGNGAVETLSFDGRGLVASNSLFDPQAIPLETQVVSRTTGGQIASVTHLNGDVEAFQYDVDGQVTSASRTGANAFASTYAYDTAGRLISENAGGAVTTYAYNTLGALISKTGPAGITTFAYDAAGSLTSRTDPVRTLNFTYDDRRLLTSSTDSFTGLATAFAHDVRGRRAVKTTAGVAETNVYGPGNEVLERYSNGALVESLLAPGSGAPQESFAPGGGGLSYFVSVTGNVDRVLNAASAVVSQQDYDPFGAPLAGPVAPGTPGFGGLRYCVETDQYDNAARTYCPGDRSFAQADPLRIRYAMRPYQRCRNDSINYEDPSGLCEQGGLSATVTEETSSGPIGGEGGPIAATDPKKITLESSHDEPKYWLEYDKGKAEPCYLHEKDDVDIACIKKTNGCKATIVISVPAAGSNVDGATVSGYGRRDPSGNGGIEILNFHITAEARKSIAWHEGGHAAIYKAYLQAYWEAAKKTLGGSHSGKPIQNEKEAKKQANKMWDDKWNALKQAMLDGVKDVGRSKGARGVDDLQQEMHTNLYWNSPKKKQAAKDGGRWLISGQHLGGEAVTTDPASHEKSGVMGGLMDRAAKMAAFDAGKKKYAYPCECTH
jgi:RHS repeat-associated protein